MSKDVDLNEVIKGWRMLGKKRKANKLQQEMTEN